MKRFALLALACLVALPIHAPGQVPTFEADGTRPAGPVEMAEEPGRTLYELLRLPGDFAGRRVVVEMVIEDVFPYRDHFSIRYRANGRTRDGRGGPVRFRLAEPLARELITHAGTGEAYDLVRIAVAREGGNYVATVERVAGFTEEGRVLFDVPAPPR
jgi:hypothetical protein